MLRSSMYASALSSSESDSEPDEPLIREQPRIYRAPSIDEDEKRIVRSAKDKRYDEMQTVVRNLNNHRKIKDMGSIFKDFEDLIKVYEKSKKMNDIEGIPKFYIKHIADLEDFVNESWESRKNLTKGTANALTKLKQRVKRYNRDFELEIKNYRENPEAYKEEEQEEDEDDVDLDLSEEDETKLIVATKKQVISDEYSSDEEDMISKKRQLDNENDNDESESDSDDSWGSSSDDSDNIDRQMEEFKDNPAAFFLKKAEPDGKGEKIKKKTAAKIRKQKPVPGGASRLGFADELDDSEMGADGAEWLAADGTRLAAAEPQALAFEKDVEITNEVVVKKLAEVICLRGRKGTSISDQLSLFSQIEAKIAENKLNASLHAKTLLYFITVLLDYEGKNPQFMSIPKFEKALEASKRLFDVLERNKTDLTVSNQFTEEKESLDTLPFFVCGNPLALVIRMDDEYRKILQNANGHEMEYVERLRDERRMVELLDRLCAYLEAKSFPSDSLCEAYLCKVEHLYYKFDFEWARRVESESLEVVGEAASHAVMERLCRFIYSNDKTDRLRTRAILCHIYYLALYDHWYKARDLMLMSNLQMNIDHADQSTMILYNRAIVQLGLCAFRQGHIREAHNALVDLLSSMRVRELLAQGLYTQARYEKSPEEEKRERALQTPYHMHINTELLECVYMVSAMLLEIPMLAAHEMDLRWRPISKAFHTALRIHDRATLVGPPETPRDHVIAAAKAMRIGNWRACLNLIINDKMDTKIWDLFFRSERVKLQIESKIKEESLRSYLFTFSSVHDSLSLDRLAELFELPKPTVYSIVCKMIINQELAASLEVPSDFLTMHKTERSRLQTLALQLAEKVNGVVEMNEKLIETRATNPSSTKIRRQYQRFGKFN